MWTTVPLVSDWEDGRMAWTVRYERRSEVAAIEVLFV